MDNQRHHRDDIHAAGTGTRFRQHAHQPRNIGRLDVADGQARGVGSCGDALEIEVCIRNDQIEDIKHLPEGCSYTVACGSAVCELAKGRSIESALSLEPRDVENELGGLPEDHLHCARLAINTLGEAIANYYYRRYGQKPGPADLSHHAVARCTRPANSIRE